jgi:hypothetical protein
MSISSPEEQTNLLQNARRVTGMPVSISLEPNRSGKAGLVNHKPTLT